MKAPPPFCIACTGKRKKLPKPIAFPAMARINPIREPQESLSDMKNLIIGEKKR
jgi:hypothetical protein